MPGDLTEFSITGDAAPPQDEERTGWLGSVPTQRNQCLVTYLVLEKVLQGLERAIYARAPRGPRVISRCPVEGVTQVPF